MSALLAQLIWAACYVQTLEVHVVEETDLLLYRALVHLDGTWL